MPADKASKEATSDSIENGHALFKVKTSVDEEGNTVEEAVGTIGNLQDIVHDSKVWQWAGVGFGDYDSMLLQKSIKNLITAKGVSQMRLWGKVKGTEYDYFIVEGVKEAAEEEGGEPLPEPRGTGVNKFVYWVTNSPLEDWEQLPDLRPDDIKNARSIKYCFSGDINRQIYTNPFYFATEKTYLRAQIARISASTILTFKGQYKFTEDTNEREIEVNAPEEGELVKPTILAMGKMEMWVHQDASILKQGKTKHSEPAPVDDVDPEVLMK